ncbi:MAG: MFS transporter [Deltaproteobacteria bacterium]|jgi:MFS family permease|nr:MFS transporter [Deltaproteobacteria bacterium]
MTQTIPKRSLHYGWYIVAAGLLCVFAGLGFGRFALGMLLPAMGQSLQLTYSQMGLISTANFVGYLLAVLVCSHISARIGSRLLIFLALLLVAFSMLLVSLADDFISVAFFYTLTGMGSGASNVPMMALVASWFSTRQRGKAAGFIVIGSGFAILLSGKLIPFINQLSSADGWRISWLVLGIIVLIIAVICLLIIRDSPAELDLQPFAGEQKTQKGGENLIDTGQASVTKKDIYHLGAIYFLFGYTYVIYATFIVTTLVQERDFSETVAGNFWSWVGFLSLFSGPVFGTLSDRLGRKAGLIMVFTIQMFAYLLVALSLPGTFLYFSIACYGIVAWSIPSIMAALVADYVGPQKTARVFGLITFIFALGQIAGPAVAGFLAEKYGTFSSSFLMASLFAGLAVLLSSLLKKPAEVT